MVTTNRAPKLRIWASVGRGRAGVTANICAQEEVSKVLRMFGCLLVCIVDFLSCQEAKAIHIHFEYKNINKNDANVLTRL